MKTKTVMDYRFGFPIQIIDCPVHEIRGEELPAINGRTLRILVYSVLSKKKNKLTASEALFLRLENGLSIESWAKVFHVTEEDVMRWETRGFGDGIDVASEHQMKQHVALRSPKEYLEYDVIEWHGGLLTIHIKPEFFDL